MNDRSYWREWPLAVFTVAIQFACGLAWIATGLEWTGRTAAASNFAIAVVPVIAVGWLASLLHLGRPLAAWRALTNARRSRLSQEVLAVCGFSCSALVCAALWSGIAHRTRLGCGSAVTLLGIVALIANARVYRIPAQPRWQFVWAMTSFCGFILFGAVALALFQQ